MVCTIRFSSRARFMRKNRTSLPVKGKNHVIGLGQPVRIRKAEQGRQGKGPVRGIGQRQLKARFLPPEQRPPQPRRRSAYIIKDVRLFLNSEDRGVRLMQTAGVGAKVSRRDTEDAICLTVTIPRAKPQKEVS